MSQTDMLKAQTLMKEIEDLKTCRDIKYSWIRRVSVVNMSVLSKFLCRFNTMPIKFQHDF